jgi:hypothetical protein
MPNRDDIPKTDPSEIEALIERVKCSGIEPRDAQLVERLLRLVLSMASLLEHKNASIKRLKRLIFGPGSDQRAGTEPRTEQAPGADAAASDSEPPPGVNPGGANSSSLSERPKRPGHGRKAASAYTGAQVVVCLHPALEVGNPCPDPHCRGHLYRLLNPSVFIQLTVGGGRGVAGVFVFAAPGGRRPGDLQRRHAGEDPFLSERRQEAEERRAVKTSPEEERSGDERVEGMDRGAVSQASGGAEQFTPARRCNTGGIIGRN